MSYKSLTLPVLLLCGLPVAWAWNGAPGSGDYRFAPWEGSGSGYGSPWYGGGAGGQPRQPSVQYRFRDAPEIRQPEIEGRHRFRPFSMDGKGYPQVPPGYAWIGGEGNMPPPVFRPLDATLRHRPEPVAPYPPLPPPWEEPLRGADYGHPYSPW